MMNAARQNPPRDGDVIASLRIANRGEIACPIIRAALAA
jgi:hypothetical protein